MTNHMIRECSNFAQKEYKTRHDWACKVIWELCKKLKVDLTNKWYMHLPEYVLENETHKLWDFNIQKDHLISTRQPDVIIIKNKENFPIVDFSVSADQSKIERKRKER